MNAAIAEHVTAPIDPGALETIEKAKADGIRHIQLQFTDIMGVVRTVTIPIHQLVGAVRLGRWFDGASVGFSEVSESDQRLVPDMSTFVVLPWLPGSGPRGTARVICDVFTRDGHAFAGDPRGVLRRQTERARKLGYIVNMGPEMEFFLFGRDANDRIVPRPRDVAGYMAFSTHLSQDDIRQDMVDALETIGFRVEAAHHEVASGQHEIDFEYADALRAADNVVTFKYVIKAIAEQNNLFASFMPKPISTENGTGMHTHQSMYSIEQGRNAFSDRNKQYGLSDLARAYMAGVLEHARGILAILAPTANSYKRLVPGFEAPTYITWGNTNRSALIRVPMITPGASLEGTRFELRCPDASANPYLAFAAMIAAGLDGIERGLTLDEPVEESLFEMDARRLAARGIKELPATLGEALAALKADSVICDALGEHALRVFVDSKTAEWDAYRVQVTPWELDSYLEAL
jgi:glutamine synthetase